MGDGNPFRLIDVLSRHNVSYVIIDDHAVTMHGFIRATEDVDIVVLRSSANDAALFAALQELRAMWIGNELDPAAGRPKDLFDLANLPEAGEP